MEDSVKSHIEYITDVIKKHNPIHTKKLLSILKNEDDNYYNLVAPYFDKYIEFLNKNGKDVDFGISCYLNILDDFSTQQIHFFDTGEYISKNDDDVNQNLLLNKEKTDIYLYGFFLADFLWPQHYKVLQFFSNTLICLKNEIHSYLDFGGAHGQYISEFKKILTNDITLNILHFNELHLKMTEMFIQKNLFQLLQGDIYNFTTQEKFDLIVISEVLEHVTNPLLILKKAYDLVNANGYIFITAPINAPAIDHIFLFNSIEEIRELIISSNFIIFDELIINSKELSEEKLNQFKVARMYSAFLKKP